MLRPNKSWRRSIATTPSLFSSDKEGEDKPTTSSGTEAGQESSKKDARAMSAEELIKQYQSKPSAEVGIQAKRRKATAAPSSSSSSENDSTISSSRTLFQKLQDNHAEAGDQDQHVSSSDLLHHGEKKTSTAPVSDQWKFLFDETEFDDDSKSSTSDNKQTAAAADAKKEKDLLDQIPGSSSMFPPLDEYPEPSRSSAGSGSGATTTTTARKHVQTSSSDHWKDPRMNSAEKDAFKALFASLFETKPKDDDNDLAGQKEPLAIFSTFKRPSTSTDDGTAETSGDHSIFSTTTTTTPPKKENPLDLLDRHLKTLSMRTGPIYVRGPEKPKPYAEATLEKTLVGDEVWAEQSAGEARDDSMFLQIREENMAAIRVRNELNGFEHDVAGLSTFVADLLQTFSSGSGGGNSSNTTTSTDQQQQQQQQPSQKPKVSGLVMDELLSRAITIASSSDVQAKTTPTLILTGPSSPSPFLDPSSQRTKSLQPLMGGAFVEHARRQGLSTFIQTVRSESYKALIRTRWENFKDAAGCLAILQEMRQNGALIDPELQSMINRMGSEIGQQAQRPSSALGWDAQDQLADIEIMKSIIREGREQDDWNGDRTTTTTTAMVAADSRDIWRRSGGGGGHGSFGDRRSRSRDGVRTEDGRGRGGYGRPRSGGRGGGEFHGPGQSGGSPFPEYIKTIRY
ncbi:hypothetical protein BGW41_002476 [Actinomortierella wolfii]|nr:hypothetical protein BGW41_002476 [Actinomortierella wolfii]